MSAIAQFSMFNKENLDDHEQDCDYLVSLKPRRQKSQRNFNFKNIPCENMAW